MYYPGRNVTDPIWRVLASSEGISSRTPLKPQHSNTNPKPLANQLWCIDFLTPPTPLIIPHRLPAFLETLMPLKNWCSIHARCFKSSLKHSIRFCVAFSQVAYRSSKVSDCIFEILQQWQSDFSMVYSTCFCSCWFEPEIIKIVQSSHKMYSTNILNFQVSTIILNACTKHVWKLIVCTSYICHCVFLSNTHVWMCLLLFYLSNTHTHTHTHIYIYIYIALCVRVCVCVCVCGNDIDF